MEEVLVRSGHRLDRRLICDELVPLLELKGTSGDGDRLRALFDQTAP